jgi:hypothetical protein
MANYPVVPQIYKGKDTGKMSRAEYEKMLRELGINKAGTKAVEYPGEEPDDATAPKKKMAKGGAVKSMKLCKGCPTPAKCKAAGKCMAKKAAAGMLVIPVKMEKTTATKYAGAGKKKAKK